MARRLRAGLKHFVLDGDFKLLSDPQLQEKGVTPYLLRAVAGESVQIPAILYDPTALGIDAQPRWDTACANPIKDDAGRVLEVVLMHEEITQRLRAEEAVRISEERFRSLVTATTQMVWTSAPDGHRCGLAVVAHLHRPDLRRMEGRWLAGRAAPRRPGPHPHLAGGAGRHLRQPGDAAVTQCSRGILAFTFPDSLFGHQGCQPTPRPTIRAAVLISLLPGCAGRFP